MKRAIVAAIALLTLDTADVALALPQRTFVASNGSDTYACTRTQPCRSFATAIANTNAGGEVIVLDSAGYGPFTVTQSVSVIAPSGVYAGVTVTTGIGITIDGTSIYVTLRGLSINGQGGGYGVRFVHGSNLTIEACDIANMAVSGLDLLAPDSSVIVRNTSIRNAASAAANINPSSGGIRVSITDSRVTDTFYGVDAFSNFGLIEVTVARSVLIGNQRSLSVGGMPGTTATMLSDGNTITNTAFVFSLTGIGATIFMYTAGNNTVGYYSTLVDGGILTTCCTI